MYLEETISTVQLSSTLNLRQKINIHPPIDNLPNIAYYQLYTA